MSILAAQIGRQKGADPLPPTTAHVHGNLFVQTPEVRGLPDRWLTGGIEPRLVLSLGTTRKVMPTGCCRLLHGWCAGV